jgi:hypothetical protein
MAIIIEFSMDVVKDYTTQVDLGNTPLKVDKLLDVLNFEATLDLNLIDP